MLDQPWCNPGAPMLSCLPSMHSQPHSLFSTIHVACTLCFLSPRHSPPHLPSPHPTAPLLPRPYPCSEPLGPCPQTRLFQHSRMHSPSLLLVLVLCGSTPPSLSSSSRPSHKPSSPLHPATPTERPWVLKLAPRKSFVPSRHTRRRGAPTLPTPLVTESPLVSLVVPSGPATMVTYNPSLLAYPDTQLRCEQSL